MRKEFIYRNEKLTYSVKRSRRAKCIRLSVYSDARVSVTIPWLASEKIAHQFVLDKSQWLLGKITHFKNKKKSLIPEASRRDYLKYRNLAMKIVRDKLVYFNRFYRFSFDKISIRNQKTRWGSCSRKGSLSFNYRVVFLPEPLCDYIIVHELCHLGRFNHSKKFWELVSKTISGYKEIRKKIKVL